MEWQALGVTKNKLTFINIVPRVEGARYSPKIRQISFFQLVAEGKGVEFSFYDPNTVFLLHKRVIYNLRLLKEPEPLLLTFKLIEEGIDKKCPWSIHMSYIGGVQTVYIVQCFHKLLQEILEVQPSCSQIYGFIHTILGL